MFSVNNLSSFSYYASSFFKEEIIPTLTEKQKKVAMVALAVFVCLAAYALFDCLCKSTAFDVDSDDDIDPNEGIVIKGNIKDGTGEKTYPDGRVLRGNFKDNVLNGDGEKILLMEKSQLEHLLMVN